MNQSLRIVEIIPTLEVGGIQRLIVQISSALAQRGHAVKLIAFHKGGALAQEFEGIDTEIWDIKPYRFLKLAHRVEQALWHYQADILHAHPGAGARLGGCKAHVPVVSTYHTIGNIRRWIPKAWDRYLAGKADALVAISGAVRDYWAKRLSTNRFEIIHNGIDLAQFKVLPNRRDAKKKLGWEGKHVLFMGRLHHEKAADVLLKAWTQLNANREWRLIIVGSGEEEPQLRRMIETLGITGSVSLLGGTSEPNLIMRAADIEVVPSRKAAFELVVVEAMAAGTPVIVSDADALPEVAGDAALIFANEDVDALVERLRQLMFDEHLAAELTGKGLHRAANFSMEKMVNGYERLFYRIAGK
jgi:glycosyltransferase involved in cell wall biosynthesis